MKNKQESNEKSLAKQQKSVMHFPNMINEMDNGFPSRWKHLFYQDWPSFEDFPAVFNGKKPSVDIIDRKDEVMVRAEIPGVDKDDLDISVTDNSVSIKASVQHEEEEEKEDYYHREISRGSYARTVALPCEIESENVNATFKHGVLELKLPKQANFKGHKVTVD